MMTLTLDPLFWEAFDIYLRKNLSGGISKFLLRSSVQQGEINCRIYAQSSPSVSDQQNLEPMNKTTFEKYLRGNLDKGITEHLVHAALTGNDEISFYVHPHGHDGETPDFIVSPSDELLPGPLTGAIDPPPVTLEQQYGN